MERVSYPGEMDRFDLPVEVVIRKAKRKDVRAMEWHGLFRFHRELLEEAWARQRSGENLMLVAEMNDSIVGQAWIDLVRRAEAGVGLLWAVRVIPWFHGLGIGSRLVQASEDEMRRFGFHVAELGVEKTNRKARRFYERHGYAVVGEVEETERYTTPEGKRKRRRLDEWVMRKALVR